VRRLRTDLHTVEPTSALSSVSPTGDEGSLCMWQGEAADVGYVPFLPTDGG
jgi:hypothetical protein